MCQSPEYFMQCLASLMAVKTSTPTVSAISVFNTIYVANKYTSLEGAIILACIDGVKTPHFTESYYLLSQEIE